MPGPVGAKGDRGEHPSEFWDSWKDLTDDFDDYPNWGDHFTEGSGGSEVRLNQIILSTFFNRYSYAFFND